MKLGASPAMKYPEIKPVNSIQKWFKEVNKLSSVQRHPVQNSSHIKCKIGSKTWLALLSLWKGNINVTGRALGHGTER